MVSYSISVDCPPPRNAIMVPSLLAPTPKATTVSTSQKTTGEASTGDSASFPLFFDLPSEIRELVYLEYIRDYPFYYHISNTKCKSCRQRPSELTNLLCSHSQINTEAAPLLRKFAKIIIPNVSCGKCREDTNVSIPECFEDITFQQPLSIGSLNALALPSSPAQPATPRSFAQSVPNKHISGPESRVDPGVYSSIDLITLPFIIYSLRRSRTFSYEFVPVGDGHRGPGRLVLVLFDRDRNITLEGLAKIFVEKTKEDLLKVYRPAEGTKITEVWKFPKGEPRVTVVNERYND